VTGWESAGDNLWRGTDRQPPNCWRYVLLRDRCYATVHATYEAVEDGVGITEHITRKLDAEIRHHRSAVDER
jgi:hypothetical protein